MNSQLAVRIQEKMNSFSKGQRRIAAFIINDYDKAAFMTASKLGETVQVSESTVVRFATELDYAGYAELQRAMQEMIRSKLTSLQRFEIATETVAQAELLYTSVKRDMDLLRHTLNSFSGEEFDKIADATVRARRVFILGGGSSLALATFLAHYFRLIFENVHLLDATNEAHIFEQLIRIDENDAIIGISFPRYSKKVIKTMQYATDMGAVSVAITDTPLSPLAQNARYAMLAKSDMFGFVDSLVAPLSLINAYVVACAVRRKEDVVANLKKLEEVWDEYGVYEKVDENSEQPN